MVTDSSVSGSWCGGSSSTGGSPGDKVSLSTGFALLLGSSISARAVCIDLLIRLPAEGRPLLGAGGQLVYYYPVCVCVPCVLCVLVGGVCFSGCLCPLLLDLLRRRLVLRRSFFFSWPPSSSPRSGGPFSGPAAIYSLLSYCSRPPTLCARFLVVPIHPPPCVCGRFFLGGPDTPSPLCLWPFLSSFCSVLLL